MPADWIRADWSLILQQMPLLVALVLICVVSMLLNVSGIELSVRQPVELDQELRCTGVANCVSGLAGGMPGFQLIGMTNLAHSLGANSRWVGVISAAVMIVPFLFGAKIITLLPTPIVGGLLIFLGLQFIHTWLWNSRLHLSATDYAIVWIILIASQLLGFLQGIGVGVLVSLILFFARYLRISVIKNQFSGADYHSRRERTLSELQWLRQHGDSISIVQLQGYIFFGTAQQILEHWQKRVKDPHAAALKYSVFDCRLVTGLDSSALLSLKRLSQIAEQQGITLLMCSLPPSVEQMLGNELFEVAVKRFATLDTAVEWCETQLLSGVEIDQTEGIAGQLITYLPDPTVLRELLVYFERKQYPKDSILIEQGTVGDEMLLVDSGEITVVLKTEDNNRMRLRTTGPGSFIGELALFGSQTRSASVIADTDVTIFSLRRQALRRMEQDKPQLANTFHRAISSLLAERLVDNTALVRALSR
jgi:SulP family sulfate permease